MKKELLQLKKEIEVLLKKKTPLIEISGMTYNRSMRGEKVPKLNISAVKRGVVTRLDVVSDPSAKWFTPYMETFHTEEGGVARYVFWVTRKDVHFVERKLSGKRFKEVEIVE